MLQEEKSRQSKEKILRAAIEEFGEKGYSDASLNTLLSNNGLSKGMVYHYFTNKDELYLGCAAECFERLMEALSQVEYSGNAMKTLHDYFEVRTRFFQEHPMLERLFFDAFLQPPAHLEKELAPLCTKFDMFNHSLFQSILNGLKLREGVSAEEGLYYFKLIQNALHLQFRFESGSYEERAYKTVEILLYGIAGGEPQ